MNITIPDEDLIPIKAELEVVLNRKVSPDELKKYIEYKVIADLSNDINLDDVIEVFGEIED